MKTYMRYYAHLERNLLSICRSENLTNKRRREIRDIQFTFNTVFP